MKLYDQFAESLQKVSGKALLCEGAENAALEAVKAVRESGLNEIFISNPGSRDMEFRKAVIAGGLSIINENEQLMPERPFAGVLRGEFAVSETGSVAVGYSGPEVRYAATLSELCIIIVPYSQVLSSFDMAASRIDFLIKNRGCPVTLVTGPSRTADIERVLTIGVHGPGSLMVIVVADGDADELR